MEKETYKKIFKVLPAALALVFLLAPMLVFADPPAAPTPDGYRLLVPLTGPGGVGGGTGEVLTGDHIFSTYAQVAFKIAVGLAAVAAVLSLIFAGIEYTVSGANEALRASAKKRIEEAMTGLLLALAGYMILATINPKMVTFSLRIPEINYHGAKYFGLPDVNAPGYYLYGGIGETATSLVGHGIITDSQKDVLFSILPNSCKSNPDACLTITKVEDVAGGKKISFYDSDQIHAMVVEYFENIAPGKGEETLQDFISKGGIVPFAKPYYLGSYGARYNRDTHSWVLEDVLPN